MQARVVLSDVVKKAAQKYHDAYVGKRVKGVKSEFWQFVFGGALFSLISAIFLVGSLIECNQHGSDYALFPLLVGVVLFIVSFFCWVPAFFCWHRGFRNRVLVEFNDQARHIEEHQFVASGEAISDAIVSMDAALFDLVEKAHWCFQKRNYRGSEEVPESFTLFNALHVNHSIDLACLVFLAEEKHERGSFSEHSNAPDQICGVPYERYEHLCIYMKSPGAYVQLKELVDTWCDREMTLLEALRLTEARNKIVETFAKQVTTEDLAQKTEG